MLQLVRTLQKYTPLLQLPKISEEKGFNPQTIKFFCAQNTCGLLCQRSQKITIHFLILPISTLMVPLSSLIPQKSCHKSPTLPPPLVSATRKFKFTSWWSFLVLGSLASLYTMHALAFICVFLSNTATACWPRFIQPKNIQQKNNYILIEPVSSKWWGYSQDMSFCVFQIAFTTHQSLWTARQASMVTPERWADVGHTFYYERSTYFITRSRGQHRMFVASFSTYLKTLNLDEALWRVSFPI